MKSKTFIWIGIIAIFVFLAGHFINIYYHAWVRNHIKGYCYQEYWGVINPVLIVEEKINIDSILQYYQKVERGDTNPVFNFPPLSLPMDTCVYILGYERDSLIAKVLCYNDWGKKGNYIKGYVFSKTLHKSPGISKRKMIYKLN